MLTQEEKQFLSSVATGAAGTSDCPIKQGAVLVIGGSIVCCGHNRLIIKDKEWQISAIEDVLLRGRVEGLPHDKALFSSYFPSLNDVKLIVAAGISAVYFFGQINDQEAVMLLNSLPEHTLEMIQLNKV